MPQRAKYHGRFDALIHAINVYRQQAERCTAGKEAFLAGCIMQGALLEACLTGMALVYRESVSKTKRYKKVKEKVWKRSHRSVRWLRDFMPSDLEEIAVDLKWVSGLNAEMDALRDARNLVHPGKYADEVSGKKRINAGYYKGQYSKLERITDQLYKKLLASIAPKLSS
jgi:hypothetical protein